MARTISMANPKGNVGRTTTPRKIAAGPAKLGRSALMINVHLQGNATTDLGVEQARRYTLLAGKPLAELVAETLQVNLDALAGSQRFSDAHALSASRRQGASNDARSAPATAKSTRRLATG